MDNEVHINTSSNWSIPGIVMKSAFVPGKLSICCVNSQSICARRMAKFIELKQMICVSTVDIICVCETWLNSLTDSSILTIEGYNLVRNDRTGRLGGGVLMYIKHGLNYNFLDMSENGSNTEYMLCEIRIHREKHLFGVFYNPPNVDCSETLNSLFCQYGAYYNGMFFLGDFNTNLADSHASRVARFQDVMTGYGVECIGTEPTFFSFKRFFTT